MDIRSGVVVVKECDESILRECEEEMIKERMFEKYKIGRILKNQNNLYL